VIRRISQLQDKHQLLFAIIIAFAVVAFWRGIWGLMDAYIFPNNYALSSWISVFIGLAVLIATDYAAKELM
jgi:hypothetical protein